MSLPAILAVLERILLTLWVGSLWVSGYIVAPMLFTALEDRALAGSLAGELFGITAWIGLACGGALLLSNLASFRGFNWRGMVLATMLLLVAIGLFVLTPMIAGLREQGLVDTTDFGSLHGLASALYVCTSLGGLLLVAAGPPEVDRSNRN